MKTASELRDGLLLVTDSFDIQKTLDHIGVDHDPSSIIAEDSYSALFVDTENGEYSEVWGAHTSVVKTHTRVTQLL